MGPATWLAGHTAKFIFRAVTATWVHDRPHSVQTTDPAHFARLRKISAFFWAIGVPMATVALAGPLPAVGAGILGWFLLVRNRAALRSIPVTPSTLVDDLHTLLKYSRPWRTVAIAAGVLAVAGIATSLFILTVGQLLAAAAWLLSLAIGYAAAVSGVEEAEGVDLSTGLERGVLALGTAANRAVSRLRKKPGTDVVR
ncbi:hypothetical protein ACVXZ4_08335 [Lacisediminihabitans sp. FW035]